MKWFKEEGDDLVPIDMFEADALMGRPDLRRVALTETADWSLSTVFLGYDNNMGVGVPECYHTAIRRGNGHYDTLQGYATRREAEIGHAAILRLLQGQTGGLILAAVDIDAAINEEIRRCHALPERDEDRERGDGGPGDGDRGGRASELGADPGHEPESDP